VRRPRRIGILQAHLCAFQRSHFYKAQRGYRHVINAGKRRRIASALFPRRRTDTIRDIQRAGTLRRLPCRAEDSGLSGAYSVPRQNSQGKGGAHGGVDRPRQRTLPTEVDVPKHNGGAAPGRLSTAPLAGKVTGARLGRARDALPIRSEGTRGRGCGCQIINTILKPLTIGRDYGPPSEVLQGSTSTTGSC